MQRLVLLVIVLGLGSGLGFAAQGVPPVPPLPPMPPARAPAAPVAPAPAAPAPVPQAAPVPVVPVPPVPPAPPLPLPLAGRFMYAPGLLFSPAASQSYFGVHLMEVTEERANELGLKEPYGVEITSVAPGSPAAEAGVLKGDIMIQYRGQRVEGQEQLIRLVRETPVGRRVPVTVRRGVSEVKLTVEIGERKAPQNMVFGCGDEPCEIRIPSIQFRSFDFDIPKPRMVVQSRLLGAELESLEDQLAGYFGVKEGVLVRAVDANSPASRAGLKAGDVIVEVDGTSVRDSSQIREAVRGSSEKAVSLGVMRNRARVALQLEPQVRETELPRPARNFRSGRF